MTDPVNAHIAAHRGKITDYVATVTPAIRMADGEEVSVQASAHHYCSPRNNAGPYTHFEVWCWPEIETPPEFEAWCWPEIETPPEFEACGGFADEPAAYVPLADVLAYIARHGGFAV
ncbi:MAG: hypothetical protein IOC86_04280 [Aestuariivirga sp.]|nr:hypothetical protein [Acidobacteriaceae bacterium]MCA3573109.1 hypothetical protein [Aestuariivirga sp.]